MKRLLVLIALALVLSACSASAQQQQMRIADGIGRAANSIGDDLERAMELDGDIAIMNALVALPAGASKDEKVAAINMAAIATEKKWSPVWRAFAALRDTHTAWATVLENGGIVPSVAGLEDAYCSLVAAVHDVGGSVRAPALDELGVVCARPSPKDGGAP